MRLLINPTPEEIVDGYCLLKKRIGLLSAKPRFINLKVTLIIFKAGC